MSNGQTVSREKAGAPLIEVVRDLLPAVGPHS